MKKTTMRSLILCCISTYLGLTAATCAASSELSLSSPNTTDFTCNSYFGSLQTILLTEPAPGTLQPGITYALGASYASFKALDTARAKLKAIRLDTGADISSTILGAQPLQADPSPSASNIPDITFHIDRPSTTETGPIQLRLSGISAKTNTETGDLKLRFGKSSSAAPIQQLDQIVADSNAQIPSVEITVATSRPFDGNTICGWPPLHSVISDDGPITARTLLTFPYPTFPNKQGNPYYPFLAVLYQNRVFALDTQHNWHPVSTCQDFPAVLPARNGTDEYIPPIEVVGPPTDLSALAGLQLVQGYGYITDPANPSVPSACEEMMSNTRYQAIYTNH